MTIRDEVGAALAKAGWVLSTQEVGKGGGGVAILCYEKGFLQTLEGGFNSQGMGESHAQRDERNAKTFWALYGALVDREPVLGVAKIPTQRSLRFRREISIMQSVEHPHLAKLLAADDSAEPTWLVMEYYSRGDLKGNQSQFIGRPLEVLQKVRGVVDALAALHAKNVRHRDIKPGNIFVDGDGRWVLGDMGIAYVDEEERLTEPGDSLFSHNWRPDWVANYRPDEYGPKVDVYMLAKTIYYMISGKNGPASQLKTRRFSLEAIFPERPDIKPVWDLLCDHITVHEEDCRSDSAEAFGKKIDQVIEALTSEPRTLFNFVSTHSFTHIVPGRESMLGTGLYLGGRARRLFGRLRVVNPSDLLLLVRVSLMKGEDVVAGVGRSFGKGAALEPGFWTEELEFEVSKGLSPGWYELRVQLENAGQGVSITGMVVYCH